MKPETYILEYIPEDDECIIGFFDSGGDMFLLGGVFLKNYYSIWDDENAQMALVPHIYTTATVTVED